MQRPISRAKISLSTWDTRLERDGGSVLGVPVFSHAAAPLKDPVWNSRFTTQRRTGCTVNDATTTKNRSQCYPADSVNFAVSVLFAPVVV